MGVSVDAEIAVFFASCGETLFPEVRASIGDLHFGFWGDRPIAKNAFCPAGVSLKAVQ